MFRFALDWITFRGGLQLQPLGAEITVGGRKAKQNRRKKKGRSKREREGGVTWIDSPGVEVTSGSGIRGNTQGHSLGLKL